MPHFHSHDKAMLAAIAVLYAGALGYGVAYDNLMVAAGIGAVVLATAVAAALAGRGGTASRIALPAIGMAMVALMIHVARGHAEAHFAVFAFLACTAVYRHWLPVVSGAATIAVHHLSFNFFQQWGWGPICFTEPSIWLVLEHAAYVVAEAVLLVFMARRAHSDFAAGNDLVMLAGRLVRPDGSIDLSPGDTRGLHPATAPFVDALNRIAVAMASVRTTAESIASAAGEVRSGSAHLGERTEQTASSLQEAASSMEQMTGTVQQTADSARTANQLASSAADVASRGGQVVEQVVATMGEISQASRRIADIIGTIDGIAFQTNILALNAAVEAARAGEQGRGFAVVASEVRSLASRSAEAARQIKGLIGASVDKVESGSALVTDAGRTMAEIVASVQRVNDMIGEISAAANEQSQGIGQINASVSQLDQMTQQNAALVEESAAAAESMSQQSRRLAEALRGFHLGDAIPATPPPAGRHAASPAGHPPAPSRRAATAAAPAPAPAAAAATAGDDWTTF